MALALALLLFGCASPKKLIRDNEGPTMVERMRGEGRSGGTPAQRDSARASFAAANAAVPAGSYAPLTRTAINESRNLFPTLPNPTLALYITPHRVSDPRTGEQLPVPGYTVPYTLYRGVQYALPGDLPSARAPISSPFPAAQPGESGVPLGDTDRLQ